MPWKRRKNPLAHDYPHLEFIPPGKSSWDCTLACLAYGIRMDMPGSKPDLNLWAACHGLPGSGKYETCGDSALVLWHGTSAQRAEKIEEHGLFHKNGLWTAIHPKVPHSFCRTRSNEGHEGAIICLVLNRNQIVEGRDYEVEAGGSTMRFHHGIDAENVAYILTKEEIRFVGAESASAPAPWPKARFKHVSGKWIPVRRASVRFSESESFSTLQEYIQLCISRMFKELGSASALEVLSSVYSLVIPWHCLRHADIIDMLVSMSSKTRSFGKLTLFLSDE